MAGSGKDLHAIGDLLVTPHHSLLRRGAKSPLGVGVVRVGRDHADLVGL